MTQLFIALLGCTLVFSACKRSSPDAVEWFIVKGKLIDKCSGGPVRTAQKLEVYNELKATTIGQGVTDADGIFQIRCDLYRPYESVYFLINDDDIPGTSIKGFTKNPVRNGDTIDFGDMEFGHDLYATMQFSLSKFSATDTFYLAYHPDSITAFYPIPSDGIINYGLYKYQTDFYYSLDGAYWSWGLGKADFDRAISKRQFNTALIKTTLCRPDTTRITVP